MLLKCFPGKVLTAEIETIKMCDEWEEDDVPFNPSQESVHSSGSGRKRAYDSRSRDNHREYSRERPQENYHHDRPPRRDREQRDYESGSSIDFLINSFDVSI